MSKQGKYELVRVEREAEAIFRTEEYRADELASLLLEEADARDVDVPGRVLEDLLTEQDALAVIDESLDAISKAGYAVEKDSFSILIFNKQPAPALDDYVIRSDTKGFSLYHVCARTKTQTFEHLVAQCVNLDHVAQMIEVNEGDRIVLGIGRVWMDPRSTGCLEYRLRERN